MFEFQPLFTVVDMDLEEVAFYWQANATWVAKGGMLKNVTNFAVCDSLSCFGTSLFNLHQILYHLNHYYTDKMWNKVSYKMDYIWHLYCDIMHPELRKSVWSVHFDWPTSRRRNKPQLNKLGEQAPIATLFFLGSSKKYLFSPDTHLVVCPPPHQTVFS